VNVSFPREVPFQGGTIKTGIFKEPVMGRVMPRRENLDGDGQADRSVHGGHPRRVTRLFQRFRRRSPRPP
jgi:MOSC domain-containing protein YiiM